jgi:hypothetical protein
MLGAHAGRVDYRNPERPPRQIVCSLCRNAGTSVGGIFRRIGRASVAEPACSEIALPGELPTPDCLVFGVNRRRERVDERLCLTKASSGRACVQAGLPPQNALGRPRQPTAHR